MSKNFFTLKTGHRTSDEYFKNMAIWHDSDLLRSGVIGFLLGSILMLVVLMYTTL